MKEFNIFSEQNLLEKVHYVYRVMIDEKHYIGKRSGLLNDLHTGRYKTSSNIIKEKLKNGSHFSKIKILQVFSSSKDALEFEERILTRVNAKRNPKFLNRTNGDKNFYNKQHTKKAKEKMSEIKKALYDINTEEGIKRRKEQSEIQRNNWDENTEQGKKLRENISKKGIERFNPDTEQGRKNLEKRSQISKSTFDPNTERGRRNRENQSQLTKARFDKNTEEGRKRHKNYSEKMKEYFNPETEQGRKNLEIHSKNMKKGAETKLQKRKDTSILGDLMFNKVFIKENFLILDDKNKPRFLWSLYSKFTGYSRSHICLEKRKGKLRFLHGIKSISLTEELENSKIREIECSLKEA